MVGAGLAVAAHQDVFVQADLHHHSAWAHQPLAGGGGHRGVDEAVP